jgi:hypothetical protein
MAAFERLRAIVLKRFSLARFVPAASRDWPRAIGSEQLI